MGCALTPYLAVTEARAALAWYQQVLGARPGTPVVMPDGRIGHAELELPGGARLFVADAHPEIGVAAPDPGAGATVTLHLEVPDTDRLVNVAVAAGAVLDRPPDDNPYGRIAVIRDPFGHRWMLNGPSGSDSG